jgi:hypothetical protein
LNPGKREAISLRKRFAVLAAGGFRCHYCGSKPPRVQLHVDHVRPVAGGGTSERRNLVAACSDCNLGKADRALDDLAPRWRVVVGHGQAWRCANEAHPGPWGEYAYGPPGEPANATALVCETCRGIVAFRDLAAA